jgi:hypothetical protein
MLVVVDTVTIGSYKSNYHTITTTIAPVRSTMGISVSITQIIQSFYSHQAVERKMDSRYQVSSLSILSGKGNKTKELSMLVVVDTGSIGSYKSNYRTITTTIALVRL